MMESNYQKDQKREIMIDDIEALTGIDFLPELEEPKQLAAERSRASNLWPAN
jgi:hypothetical protein